MVICRLSVGDVCFVRSDESLCVSLSVFFFFFKQKTAYVLRISDWSSDVCSSDLILADLLKIDAIGSPIIRQIPRIGKASAGAWKEAIHDPMGWMPCPDPSFPKGVFALFIDGDSIDKIAPDGATIIVDPSDKLLVDRALYLMMNGTGGATVKLFFSDPARLEP